MSVLSVPNIHQIRAAMLRALSVNNGTLTQNEMEAIEMIDEFIELEVANPCKCTLGENCHYRGLPPGDDDTGHCQECGHFMADDDMCESCGADYIVDADGYDTGVVP